VGDTLDRIPAGARVLLEEIGGPLGTRLAELGIVAGVEVEVVQAIPLGGPVVIDREGFLLALRRGDARAIRVRRSGP